MELGPHTIHAPSHRVHVENRPAATVGDREIVYLRKVGGFLGLRVVAVVTDSN